MTLVLVQMHGEPGSGKSTVARGLGRVLPAIVLDKDVIKSAMMRTGVPAEFLGLTSQEVMRDLARDILRAGHSVVLDCPAGWPVIVEKGQALAAEMEVPYGMIETRCADRHELVGRLRTRVALESNPTELFDWGSRPGTAEPTCERLVLDGMRPVDELVAEAVEYVVSRAAHWAAATGERVGLR